MLAKHFAYALTVFYQGVEHAQPFVAEMELAIRHGVCDNYIEVSIKCAEFAEQHDQLAVFSELDRRAKKEWGSDPCLLSQG